MLCKMMFIQPKVLPFLEKSIKRKKYSSMKNEMKCYWIYCRQQNCIWSEENYPFRMLSLVEDSWNFEMQIEIFFSFWCWLNHYANPLGNKNWFLMNLFKDNEMSTDLNSIDWLTIDVIFFFLSGQKKILSTFCLLSITAVIWYSNRHKNARNEWVRQYKILFVWCLL